MGPSDIPGRVADPGAGASQPINLLNGHDVDADQVKAGEIQTHVLLGLNPGLINASEQRAKVAGFGIMFLP